MLTTRFLRVQIFPHILFFILFSFIARSVLITFPIALFRKYVKCFEMYKCEFVNSKNRKVSCTKALSSKDSHFRNLCLSFFSTKTITKTTLHHQHNFFITKVENAKFAFVTKLPSSLKLCTAKALYK